VVLLVVEEELPSFLLSGRIEGDGVEFQHLKKPWSNMPIPLKTVRTASTQLVVKELLHVIDPQIGAHHPKM